MYECTLIKNLPLHKIIAFQHDHGHETIKRRQREGILGRGGVDVNTDKKQS